IAVALAFCNPARVPVAYANPPTGQLIRHATPFVTRLDIMHWFPRDQRPADIHTITTAMRRDARMLEFTRGLSAVNVDLKVRILVTVIEYGWPARSLWGYRTTGNRHWGIARASTLWSPEPVTNPYPNFQLPTRPILPGFLI